MSYEVPHNVPPSSHGRVRPPWLVAMLCGLIFGSLSLVVTLFLVYAYATARLPIDPYIPEEEQVAKEALVLLGLALLISLVSSYRFVASSRAWIATLHPALVGGITLSILIVYGTLLASFGIFYSRLTVIVLVWLTLHSLVAAFSRKHGWERLTLND